MKLFQNLELKKFLKFFYKFIVTIYVFESVPKKRKKIKIKPKIFQISDRSKILKNKIFKNYFKTCYYKNSRWNIEEIDKKVFLKNEKILYDFFTNKKFRNRGYYKLLLKIIQNKYLNRKLIIYTVSNNKHSKKAILSSGFKFKKILRKF